MKYDVLLLGGRRGCLLFAVCCSSIASNHNTQESVTTVLSSTQFVMMTIRNRCRFRSMHVLSVISVVFRINALSLSALATNHVDETTNDYAPNPSQAYIYAQNYVHEIDSHLQTIYFPDVIGDAEKDDDVNALKVVKHLIIGRGVAGTNLFASRYAKVMEYDDGASPYTCDGSYSYSVKKDGKVDDEDTDNLYLHDMDGSDVLVVGDNVTGLWNTATATLGQTLSALTFPYLPYNPVDFAGQDNPARVERDEFVSCVDMHRALLTSQCATRAPVLTALVEDVRLAKGDEECAKVGGVFMVTLENVKHHSNNNSTANAKQTLLCVGEIDIATGRGVPRSAFKDESSATGYKYGINETVYEQITGPKSSGFGLAPALIDDFRKFVFSPDEDVSEVATPKEDGTPPIIIVDGGGATPLSAIRRAMLARDDISKNIVYTDPDSTFNCTKNPQMIRKVRREPAIQNAVVHWVSRGDLSDISLRGKNEVRGGSAYSIVDLFNTASSKSIYEDRGGFGSANYFKNLCCIDFNTHPMIATFCPYYSKNDGCACCEDANDLTALQLKFDQFVSCIGEDDTEVRKELYGDQRFGDSILINAALYDTVLPYAVGFDYTYNRYDGYHTLRIFGAAATNEDLVPKDPAEESFNDATQKNFNGGQVVPLHFAGNMLAMMSQLQIYTTTVFKKRIAKINLSMSTSDFILRFLDEACVPLDTRTEFVNYLQLTNNKTHLKNDIEWPLNPNGIGEEDLRKYIEQNNDLSKNICVSRGRTLVSKHDQPCVDRGDDEDNGDATHPSLAPSLTCNNDKTDTGGGDEIIVPPRNPSRRLLKLVRSSIAKTVVVIMVFCGSMIL